MHFKQLTSLLLLGLGVVTFGYQHQDEYRDLVVDRVGGPRGVADALSSRGNSVPKAPGVCTKPAPMKTGPPPPAKSKRAVTDLAGDIVKRSDLVRRAGAVKFLMNQSPQWATLNGQNDVLWTSDLGGCSVVIIASPTAAFAVHVSRGSTSTNANNQLVHNNDQDQMAKTAVTNLMNLYNEHKSQAGNVKAMVITADQGHGGDSVLNELWAGLSTISSKNYDTYDATAIYQMPAGEAKSWAGTLQIRWVGGSHMPSVYLGSTCYQFPS